MSILGLILVTSKRSGMLGERECVALGVSMILCSTTDLVPASVCMPFGASGFKFGSWVDVVTSADDKILCQIVVCLWGMGRGPHGCSAYDFNLLMYFLALRIGTRCLPGYHGPFVSPLSTLLALCLLFCLLLLLPAAAAWLGFLFCSTAESS